MAVTSTKLVSTTGGIDGDGHINLTANWEVYTDSRTDNAYTILLAVIAASPATWNAGGQHGSGTNANCGIQSIGQAQLANVDDTARKWTCPAVYSTKPLKGPDSSSRPLTPFTTPLAEPWRISGTFERTDKIVLVDQFGAPITLAGTLEIKAVTIPGGHDTLHMEGHTAFISIPDRAQAIFHCNASEMWGLEPRQLLMIGWAYEIVFHAGTAYVRHALDWSINYDGWNESILNVSHKKKNPDYNPSTMTPDKFLLPYLDALDQPFTDPGGPLDQDGNPVDNPDDCFEQERLVIHEFDFLSLGFPDPLPGPFA